MRTRAIPERFCGGDSLRRGAISSVCTVCLSVCLSRTSGLTREQRSLGRLKLAQSSTTSHVTRTPLSRSRSPGRLLTAVLARQAAAAVRVGTCWQCDTSATLPSARLREALRRPQGEERGGGISWRPPAYSLLASEEVTVQLVVSKWDLVCYCTGIQPNPNVCQCCYMVWRLVLLTSCARGDTICPRPSPPPRGRHSASCVAEQTQRSSTFPRRIRSHADCCSRLIRVKAALSKAAW